MSNRFKVLVAALGLVVAAGTIGEASATTVAATPIANTTTATPVAAQGVAGKTVIKKTVVGKTVAAKTMIGRHHRIRVAHKGVIKHAKVAHRVTTRAKIAHKLGLKHVAAAAKTGKTIVR